MKRLHNIIAGAAALVLAVTLCVTAFGDSASYDDMAAAIASAQKIQLGIAETDPLLTEENLPAGSSVSDWTALAMARAGVADDYEGYLSRLQSYVEQKYAENGGLHEVKATEYHRIALTAAALGGDPTAFGTKPDGTAIDLVADGTYNWQGENELGAQGLNGWIFALLAMDAVGAEAPADARYSRESIVDTIVSAQLPEGGFALGGSDMDVDITAMALQALAAMALRQQGHGRFFDLTAVHPVQLETTPDTTTETPAESGGSFPVLPVVLIVIAIAAVALVLILKKREKKA